MKFNETNMIRTWIQSLRSLPRIVWVLMFFVFILGVLVRGGGRGTNQDMAMSEHVHEEEEVDWWTCSMHPQVKLPEPGQCPICYMDLIPMEMDGSGNIPTELKMSPAAVKLAEIATIPVRRGPAQKTNFLSGKVAEAWS